MKHSYTNGDRFEVTTSCKLGIPYTEGEIYVWSTDSTSTGGEEPCLYLTDELGMMYFYVPIRILRPITSSAPRFDRMKHIRPEHLLGVPASIGRVLSVTTTTQNIINRITA